MSTLLIGGPMDGQEVEFEGNELRVEDMDRRLLYLRPKYFQYYKVALAGHTQRYFVGVPKERAGDGNWIMEQLLKGYKNEDHKSN